MTWREDQVISFSQPGHARWVQYVIWGIISGSLPVVPWPEIQTISCLALTETWLIMYTKIQITLWYLLLLLSTTCKEAVLDERECAVSRRLLFLEHIWSGTILVANDISTNQTTSSQAARNVEHGQPTPNGRPSASQMSLWFLVQTFWITA